MNLYDFNPDPFGPLMQFGPPPSMGAPMPPVLPPAMPSAPPDDNAAIMAALQQAIHEATQPPAPIPNRPSSFLDRLATGLAANPIEVPQNPRGGRGFSGSSFFANLIGGGANAFAKNREQQIMADPGSLPNRMIRTRLQTSTVPVSPIQRAKDLAEILKMNAEAKKALGASTPTTKPAVPIKLGKGSSLVDPSTGRVITAGPSSAPGGSVPADFTNADKILGDSIINGLTPVTALGNRVTDKNRGVLNYLATQKFDFTKTAIDFNSVRKHFESVNSPTQARLQQAYQKVTDTLPLLHDANTKFSALAPRFTVTPISRLVNMGIQDYGAGGAAAREAATNLYTFATTLQFELAVAYQGGTSPTEETMKKAAKIINPDMSPDRIEAAAKVALKEIKINQASINKAGAVSPSNPAGVNGAGGFNIGNRRIDNATTTVDSSEVNKARAFLRGLKR